MNLSVLLSVHANEKPEYFNHAFLSIWDQQTLKPGQIVLVKDGPLTLELDTEISKWQARLGEVITLVTLPENLGLGAALNAGLKACKHELVARMDTDDISLPERFASQVSYLEDNHTIDVLGSFVIEISDSGVVRGNRSMPRQHEAIIASLWACPLVQ